MMRYLIIGDIHGCFEELKELVELFNPINNDQIICTGDILNRQYNSSKSLSFLKNINAVSVLGNHEKWFLDNIENYNSLDNKQKERITNLNAFEFYKWIREWPLIIEKKDFIVVHAGFNPLKNIYDNSVDNLVSIREIKSDNLTHHWYKFYDGNKKIFYGHFAKLGFHNENNTVCLDGGCVYGKKLIGCIVENGDFNYISINAKKEYEHIVIK